WNLKRNSRSMIFYSVIAAAAPAPSACCSGLIFSLGKSPAHGFEQSIGDVIRRLQRGLVLACMPQSLFFDAIPRAKQYALAAHGLARYDVNQTISHHHGAREVQGMHLGEVGD